MSQATITDFLRIRKSHPTLEEESTRSKLNGSEPPLKKQRLHRCDADLGSDLGDSKKEKIILSNFTGLLTSEPDDLDEIQEKKSKGVKEVGQSLPTPVSEKTKNIFEILNHPEQRTRLQSHGTRLTADKESIHTQRVKSKRETHVARKSSYKTKEESVGLSSSIKPKIETRLVLEVDDDDHDGAAISVVQESVKTEKDNEVESDKSGGEENKAISSLCIPQNEVMLSNKSDLVSSEKKNVTAMKSRTQKSLMSKLNDLNQKDNSKLSDSDRTVRGNIPAFKKHGNLLDRVSKYLEKTDPAKTKEQSHDIYTTRTKSKLGTNAKMSTTNRQTGTPTKLDEVFKGKPSSPTHQPLTPEKLDIPAKVKPSPLTLTPTKQGGSAKKKPSTPGRQSWTPTKNFVTFQTGSPCSVNTSKLNLSQLIDKDQRIDLPDHFLKLEHLFNSLEYTVMFMKGRDHSCVFHKIRKAVENAADRAFSLRSLGQIKAIFPSAYHLEAVKTLHNGERVESISIDFNGSWREEKLFNPLLSPSKKEAQEARNRGISGSKDLAEKEIDLRDYRRVTFAGRELEARRRKFRANLISLVEKKHEEFLKSQNLTWTQPNSWHTQFNLDEVPVIEPDQLPKLTAAVVDVKAILGLKQNHLPSSVENTLVAKKLDFSSVAEQPVKDKQQISSSKQRNKSKFNNLLERVRAKEMQLKEDIFGSHNPIVMKKKLSLSRLPAIIDTISFSYRNLNKSALPLAEISSRVVNSYKNPLSEQEATSSIELLSSICPDFCQICIVGKLRMVRINRSILAKEVKDKVSQEIQKLESTKQAVALTST